MSLSKRERTAGAFAVLLLAALGVDRFVRSPLTDRQNELAAQTTAQEQQLENAKELLKRESDHVRRWSEMQAAGLGADRSAAESQTLHAVRDWAQETGLNLSSIKPDRVDEDKQFHRILFRATATGSMRSVEAFAEKVQKASIPVRLVDLQISARKEATDDLSLQFGVSTLYLAPAEKGARAAAPTARETKP